MSQALFHADEQVWEEWNSKNIRYLSTLQARDGSWPGTRVPLSAHQVPFSPGLELRFLPI